MTNVGEQQVLYTGGYDHSGQWYIVTKALSLIKKFMVRLIIVNINVSFSIINAFDKMLKSLLKYYTVRL